MKDQIQIPARRITGPGQVNVGDWIFTHGGREAVSVKDIINPCAHEESIVWHKNLGLTIDTEDLIGDYAPAYVLDLSGMEGEQ